MNKIMFFPDSHWNSLVRQKDMNK